MIIITSEDDKSGILELKGHINALPAHELKDFLDSISGDSYSVFIVDLSRVRSISTSGTGLIYAIKNKLDDLDIPLAFVGKKQEVMKLQPDFTIDKSIPFVENRGKALITLRSILFRKNIEKRGN